MTWKRKPRPISVILDGDTLEVVILFLECRLSWKCSWLRLFGWGIHCRRLDYMPLLFGERNGFTAGFQIGQWYVKSLRPFSLANYMRDAS